MQCCVISGCTSSDESHFYRIPRAQTSVKVSPEKRKLTLQRQQLWLSILHPEFSAEDCESIEVDGYVCERHFQSGKPARLDDTENVDWVPNQHLGYVDDCDNQELTSKVIDEIDDQFMQEEVIEIDDEGDNLQNGSLVHTPIPTDNVVYKCVVCLAAFPKLDAAKQHMLVHKSEPIIKPSPIHRCGMCSEGFPTKEECVAHINMQHGSGPPISDVAHKRLSDLVETLVKFDWCRCMTCLLLCKSLLDHVFETHPVKSATMEKQKQAQASQRIQKEVVHIDCDHSYDNQPEPVPVKKVVKKKKKPYAERAPNPRKVTTISLNRSTDAEAREEFQCYYCGDASLAKEDIVKCLKRHTENGWTDLERIEIGGDTFQERTIEVDLHINQINEYSSTAGMLIESHDIDTAGEIIINDKLDMDGNEYNLNKIAALCSAKTFTCNPCNLHFESAKELRQHVLSHRKGFDKFDHNTAKVRIKHNCKFCTDDNGDQLSFDTRQESMRHRRELHFYFPKEEVIADKFVRFVVMPDGTDVTVEDNYRYFMKGSFIERFECVCLINYSLKRLADRCLAKHIGEKSYKCVQTDCHHDFYTEQELRSHEARIHFHTIKPELVVCEECGVEVNKAYLKHHWRKAHSAPAVCDHCGNVYKNAMRLRVHVRTVHQKEKNHRCKICSKRFIHKSSANLCQAKHNDERNVPCNFCERMFYTSAQRNSHRLANHGKMELRHYNYFCDRCDFVARTRTILQRHMFKAH